MMDTFYGPTQAEADAAFAKYFPRADELPWAVGVITGDIALSPEQLMFLNHCAGSGSRMNSQPTYGHLAVRCLGTEGRDNQAAAVSLLPATPECRRLAEIIRRWQRVLGAAK